MAAVFGLWFKPTYLDFVGLWTCVSRQMDRSAWETKTGTELAANKGGIPPEFFNSISPNEFYADYLCYETNNKRADQCLMNKVGPLPRR